MIKNIYFAFLFMVLVAACNQMGPLDRYSVSINNYRDKKDSLFKFNADQSPLPNETRRYFRQLTYYAPDSTYRLEADYQKIPNPDTLIMQGTHGDKRPFLREGVLYFKIKGKDYKLIAYKSVPKLGENLQSSELFVPFYDETNKKETHGSGRYLDIEYNGQDKVMLDFNYAYNPYCEYNNGFTCPITPFENKLPIRIEAGEKRWEL